MSNLVKEELLRLVVSEDVDRVGGHPVAYELAKEVAIHSVSLTFCHLSEEKMAMKVSFREQSPQEHCHVDANHCMWCTVG